MESDAWSAMIGAAATLAGVLIGGVLQFLVGQTDRKRKRLHAIRAIAVSTADTRRLFLGRSVRDVREHWESGVTMPAGVTEHLRSMIKLATEEEPLLAMPLVWLLESMEDFDIYVYGTQQTSRSKGGKAGSPPTESQLQSALLELSYARASANRLLLIAYSVLPFRERRRLRRDVYFAEFWAEYIAGLPRIRRFLAKTYLYIPRAGAVNRSSVKSELAIGA